VVVWNTVPNGDVPVAPGSGGSSDERSPELVQGHCRGPLAKKALNSVSHRTRLSSSLPQRKGEHS
ncbi:hypothetical protein NDU88_004014, partial [Pleurodeles waltl]